MSLPKNFSKSVYAVDAKVQGLNKNKADFASAPDQAVVKPFVDNCAKIKALDAKQEQAKAALHQTTEELKAALKDLEGIDSQLVSLIYAKYTKKSDKLEEFGLKAWKHGGKKGPRAKKA